jgi:serine-type D-Ala-D-Ala carboxypeptidase/endopeptidase (penicillin-binding protein 4)
MRLKNSGLLAGLFLIGVSVSLFLIFHNAGLAREDKPAKTSPATVKETTVSKDSTFADSSLARDIDRLIDESDQKARWGVYVMSPKDGRVLYSRDGDRPFTPASNMKIYTTAVALDLLGPDYRWRTSVFASKQPDAKGIIDGDLTLYGRGAPDLISKPKGDAPSLSKLAEQLYQSGIRQIRGNIVGDASYLRGELFGIGWQWNDLQWYFGAEPSALSVDENTVEVTIAPATKPGTIASVITSEDKYLHLTNKTSTGERNATTTIGIMRDLSNNNVQVWGDFPVGGRAFSAFLSVHDPALWAATLFKQALIARGIKVDGETRSQDFRVPEADKFDPQKAFELVYLESATLGEIARKTNKESNNLFAELILRTLGKERGASAPDPNPRKNRERGDDEAGSAVIRSWLESKGIATRALAIRDGSGLSRLDLVTPEATARLLTAMTNSKAAAVFHDSLPVAGRDGTISGRLKSLVGRVSAKTGTLTYVHSLSGYATTPTNETLVFSLMCNDAILDRSAVRVIDQMATAIAGLGQPQPSK